eukprot:scaffold13198_cov94-Skeletonema_dohrnii-CCMP3373.AAC.2
MECSEYRCFFLSKGMASWLRLVMEGEYLKSHTSGLVTSSSQASSKLSLLRDRALDGNASSRGSVGIQQGNGAKAYCLLKAEVAP